ncbi:hypothetical protein HPP92_013447, partial [Vanilla planifolia]
SHIPLSDPSSDMSSDAFRMPSSIVTYPNPNPNLPQQRSVKKKRSLPGTPDPEAEVIALSPRTLMATNRFVCEICNKGFQRDQNLQLHRRGHNLSLKLRQRPRAGPRPGSGSTCPEPSCVHHDPARALGDLTGIKKHFSRKHGEKKWKCERCGKRYAVPSDYKAHSKTCGTREYRCDCGTVFSRKDSFVTHRAFCDALTQETTAVTAAAETNADSLSDETPTAMPTRKAELSLWLSRSEMMDGGFPTHPAPAAAYMSATALLQKAAQIGATTSGAGSSSFFGGLMRSMKGPMIAGTGVELMGRGMTRDFLGLGEDGGRGGGAAGREMQELTRDFLGLGEDGGRGGGAAGREMQELTRFASLGSGVEFLSTSTASSYNGAC